MDIKLIAIDIDGTLLNEKNVLAPATIEAIKNARANGVKVVLCTGRPLTGVKQYLEKLNIDGDDEYVSTYNGALVESANGKEIINEKLVSFDDYLEVEMLAREMNVNFQVETADRIIAVNRDISYFTSGESYLVQMPICYRSPEEITRNTEMFKLMLVGMPDPITNALNDIPKSLFDRMSIVQSEPVFIEFMNKQVSKANALKALAKKLNLKPENIMAIGDQGNDTSMIKYAGLGVSMGNGIDDNKKIANFVTKTNAEDGVAFAINKYVNNK